MVKKDENFISILKSLKKSDWIGFVIACLVTVIYGVLFGLSEELGFLDFIDRINTESLLGQIIIFAGILSFVVVFRASWAISASFFKKWMAE